MKTTSKNLPMILGIIKKIASTRPLLHSQCYYTTSVKLNGNMRRLGLKPDRTIKSNLHTFDAVEMKIYDSIGDDYKYININNGVVDNYDWDSNYKSLVIYEGCDIVFKNNMLIIKQQHPTKKGEKCIEKIWFTEN